MILTWLRNPWPWYVSGPLLGLFVPLLLVIGNKLFGMSSSLRAMCAAVVPGRVDFFRYDWRQAGLWNVTLALGILVGAVLAATVLGGAATPAVSEQTRLSIENLGLSAPAGLVPVELLSWKALLTVRGALFIVVGGFLIGFGSSYGGGCTSGHGVTGIATFQLPSVIALIGIFAGGLFTTFVLFPLIF